MTAPDSRDSVELLPCPGCGDTRTRVIGGPGTRGGPKYWAGCDVCRWRTWGNTEAEAVGAWNRRALPQQAGGEDAWSALETWLGTFADSIPAQAYHELCAIQRSIAADKEFLRGVIDSGRQQQAELLQRAETAEAALREAGRDAAKLREALADIYAAVPKMPIEPETCDAATDALMNVCYVVGALAHGMPELDAAIGGTDDA